MKKVSGRFSILLTATLLLALFSCNKSKNEGLNYIPKDVTLVVNINLIQIHDKLQADNISTDSLMALLDQSDNEANIIQDFDPKQPLLVFVRSSSSMAQGNQYLSGTVAIVKDVTKLEEHLKTKYPDEKIEQGKGYAYLTASNNEIISWNKKVAIILSSSNTVNPNQLEELYSLKKEESLGANNNANSVLTSKADVSYYVNSANSLTNVPYIGMTKASDLLKDTYGGGTINFEKGQINIAGSQYLNSTATDLIKQNPTQNLTGESLAAFPGKPDLLLNISFNVKQIISFLDYAGIKNTADIFLQKVGITLDDLATAFNGEIGIAASSFAMKNKTIGGDINMQSTQPSADFIIDLPITNYPAYNKIANALARMGIFVPFNGQLVPSQLANANSIAYYSANEKSVILASSQNFANTFLSGTEKIELPDGFVQQNKTAAFYVNIQNIIHGLRPKDMDSANFVLAENTFQDMVGDADNLKGNVATSHLTIHLQDKNKNSLSTFINFFTAFKKLNTDAKNNPSPLSDDLNTNIPPPPNMDTSAVK